MDQIAEYLESLNIPHFLVEVGGELRGKGRNSADFPWKVAVEKPASGKRTIQQVLFLQNHAMATSGDYRNFFENDGQRFSHTINPQTGQPVVPPPLVIQLRVGPFSSCNFLSLPRYGK